MTRTRWATVADVDSPRPPIHIVHSDPSQIPQQFPASPTSISGPVGRLKVSALIPRSVTLGFPIVPHGQWKRVPHAERTCRCLFKRVKTTQANGPSGLSACSTVSGTTSYSRILPLLARPWVGLANPMPISTGMPALVPDRSVTGLVLPLVCLVCWVWYVSARLGRLASLAPWPAARDQGGVRLELSQHGGLCCGSRSGCGMMDPELGEGFVCRTGLQGATLCVLATLPGRYWYVSDFESLLPRSTLHKAIETS
ncbi:uncharacterized protein B0T23DRAFT_221921 [Neurospora hispaniola]|uniref:Uncharacterized protein n=1 Tax=Neurospora hispaniola TaxID=588809 RepID=A0AAJ0MNS4_9PEZI|nr:hypothetical protein B0T23DRAFT_221921 [Neurospora hispaniola]